MQRRQIVIAWIVGVLVAAVFFLNAVICSDRNIRFSVIVPLFMSLPFVLVGGILIYFSGGRRR